jgi:hypothetical protein
VGTYCMHMMMIFSNGGRIKSSPSTIILMRGLNFSHDPYIIMPPHGALGEIDKKSFQFSKLFYFVLII